MSGGNSLDPSSAASPEQKQPIKVLLFGSGAIGTIYIYLLQQAGCLVTAVCRSNYEAASTAGFQIYSERFRDRAPAPQQPLHIRPRVVRTVEALGDDEVFDYILVCSKAFPGGAPSTAELIAPAVTEGKTTIALIQNGVGIEDEYVAKFPRNTLLSCVVYLPTTQVRPGVIEMGDFELLEIGPYPALESSVEAASDAVVAGDGAEKRMQDAQRLRDLIRAGGGTAEVFADIQPQRWKKLLINASWNPICALSRSSDTEFMASSAFGTEYAGQVMDEVVDVARALGYTSLTKKDSEEMMQRAKDRIGGKGIEPSMLADVRNGRRMEVEAILGNTVRMGLSKGVKVEKLVGLYVLAKALDESMAREKHLGTTV